jgi:hypothetical protein
MLRLGNLSFNRRPLGAKHLALGVDFAAPGD